MSSFARTLAKRLKANPGPNLRAKLAKPPKKRAARGSRRGKRNAQFIMRSKARALLAGTAVAQRAVALLRKGVSA